MKFLLVIASVISVTYGHSPVLLWPADEFSIPDGQSALDSMSLDDFKKLFEGKKMIVFHKKTFNLEEVSYPLKQMSYLQSVDAIALQGVKSIHHFVGGLVSSDNLKLVRLTDGPLDKQQDEIRNAMASNPGFAAILVGSGSHRSRRAADGDKTAACSVSGNCIAYVGAIEKSDGTAGKCSVTCEETGMTIAIDGSETKLTVTKDAKTETYSLSVPEPYQLETDTLWAPMDFSYSCGTLRLVPRPLKNPDANKLPTITLRRMQVYPQKGEKFPESYDCSTWFTPAIWMGVVMATFYIFLLFGAVVFLLDVKTNDRFDDPKGKTITVNVAE